MTKDEALKMALEALEDTVNGCICRNCIKQVEAITSLRQAIEQAEKQEPVAVIRTWHKMGEQHAELWNWHTGLDALPDGEHTLYTTPQPQREWVGLTPTDIADALGPCPKYFSEWTDADVICFARAIEAKLKEKNT